MGEFLRLAGAALLGAMISFGTTLYFERRKEQRVSSSDLAPLVVMNIGSSVPAELKAWGDNPAAWTG